MACQRCIVMRVLCRATDPVELTFEENPKRHLNTVHVNSFRPACTCCSVCVAVMLAACLMLLLLSLLHV